MMRWSDRWKTPCGSESGNKVDTDLLKSVNVCLSPKLREVTIRPAGEGV